MRASRLLAILILLQNRGRLTADALAAEFEVSERTIYRDIDALSAAGVPVYGDRGPGGGFALLDGYRTRLTGMANEEAEAIALAGIPDAAKAAGLGAALASAFQKLLAALPVGGSQRSQLAAARFHIDPADWYRAAEPAPYLPALARAVLDGQRIEVDYASWTARRRQQLDPLGLVLKSGQWYLVAVARRGAAIYRVAAIERLAVQDARFTPPRDFDLGAWWDAAQARFEASLFSAAAIVRASTAGCERLARLSPRGRAAVSGAEPPDAAGWRELSLAVEDSDHGARELLGLGPEIEVISPASLRQRIGELAAATAALHLQDEAGRCESGGAGRTDRN